MANLHILDTSDGVEYRVVEERDGLRSFVE